VFGSKSGSLFIWIKDSSYYKSTVSAVEPARQRDTNSRRSNQQCGGMKGIKSDHDSAVPSPFPFAEELVVQDPDRQIPQRRPIIGLSVYGFHEASASYP
jgi:hypothetical protein